MYFVFFSPQAFNLLFLNLPLLPVFCIEHSRALDLKVNEHQGGFVHPTLFFPPWCKC